MRFDVYKLARGAIPYVVDVQSDFMSALESRMVIPVLPAGKVKKRVPDLQPVVEIAGTPHVLMTYEMSSVLRKELGRSFMSLIAYRDEITRALDLLFTGF
jgi:toxin CcdB